MVSNGVGLGGFLRRSSTTTTKNINDNHKNHKMDFPKLQPRSSASTFPPPHKTQLPARYQTQHFQNQSNHKSPSHMICKRTMWLMFALFSFLFVILYMVSLVRGLQLSSQRAAAANNQARFGIIIDAGSSGSRIHVFQYRQGVIPEVDLIGLDSHSLKRTPGLSSFAGMRNSQLLLLMRGEVFASHTGGDDWFSWILRRLDYWKSVEEC